jgi:hypothetical protein
MGIEGVIDNFQKKEHYYEHIDCLEKHLSKYFKTDEMTVFHEFVSLDFHLDVYLISPKDSSYNILITSGMSLLAMTLDDGIEQKEDYRFAELMVLFPKEVAFEKLYTGKEKNSWIISMLKETARFPHHYDTFLAIGHTIQATEDMQPYADDTKFMGCLILPSVTFDEEFTEFYCGNNKINIYSLFPLYKNELVYKIQEGYGSLLDILIEANANEVMDLNRKNLLD